MTRLFINVTVMAVMTALFSASATAADLYSSGAITWDTSTANWAATTGAPYTDAAWNNTTPDSAIFEGTAGTVTLSTGITVEDIVFNTGNYTITGNTLTFAAGGAITNEIAAKNQTISSAIAGSPDVYITDSGSSYNTRITFSPSSGSQTLGTATVPFNSPNSGDKCRMTLGGTTTGNSVFKIQKQHNYGHVYKEGSGTWSVGDVDVGTVYLQDGNLIATGTVHTYYGGLEMSGGVFHYNNAGAVYNRFRLYNASFDNSSGAAIASPTYNADQTWGGNWTFIGSNGSNSDLNLGTGAVSLNGNRTVTVQNAATTLTVGGVITDGGSSYGLTKAGAGTLDLDGNNTYNGGTTVSAGTLSIAYAYLDDSAVVLVASGATLDLDFVGTDTVFFLELGGSPAAVGEWGPSGSGAANESALLTGSGRLYNDGGVAPDGIYYWDGGNTGGTGDGASDGGAGTWSTSNDNWDHGFIARQVWPNTTNDQAIFRTSAGVVDLQSDITLGEILIDGAETYTIGSAPETQVMNFGGNASIIADKVHATINAGITGSPDVHHYGGFRRNMILDPDSASMTLGTVTIGEDTSSNPNLYLRGTTTGNSATAIQKAYTWVFVYKQDSGTWTVGDVDVYRVDLDSGTLVANGTWVTGNIFDFAGGTLAGTGVINDAVNVPASGFLTPGDPTGALTVTNNACTINGTLDIAINDAASPKNGKLIVHNTLTISSATLDFSVSGSVAQPVYVIAAYNTLSGTFSTINNLPTGYSVDYNYLSGNQIAIVAETTPPTPSTMTWSVVPAGLSPSKIDMTATTATDASGGIEYYFENTSNLINSGWISLSTWTNISLAGTTTYGYRVKARDLFGNETGWSTPDAEATTLSADGTPPTPSTMTFAVAPAAESATAIVMTATTASDPSGPIEYFFLNTSNAVDSGWITSTIWTNTGLSAETTYGYTVKARDAASNENTASAEAKATTPENTPPTPSPMVFEISPASLDATRIVMTATNATDPSGPVEYYFVNTTNASNSGWISTTVWTNTSLTLGTLYGYQVKARDALGNETVLSTEAFATPANETTPPNPDPMTFAVAPAQDGADSIAMTATTAIDELTQPVQYYFENTTNANNSGWISSAVWTNTGLADDTTYGYTVKARDALSNETAVSVNLDVFLPRPPITLYWDGPNYGATGDGASAGGPATWSTSVTNWDEGSGQPRVAWYNGSDNAILGGSVGTVTLGENISLGHLRFTAAGNNYTVAGNTLNFSGGSITQSVKNIKHTITSAITGSPDVGVINGTGYEGMTFAPTSGSVVLGTLTVPYDDPVGGDKAGLHLAGTTTGNSAGKVRFDGGDKYGAIYKDSSGTWALGDVDIGIVYLNAGDLVANGTIRTWYAGFQLKGGTFHYNNPGAVTAHQGLNFNGGVGAVSLDNSSGAAITTSTYNPQQSWGVDWTFIGSSGANSDLNLGTGAVTLSGGDRQVTVQDAAATLTIDGVVGDGGNGYTLTKAGAGSLALTGANTYSGETIVNAGMLSISQAYLSAIDAVRIAAGATLNLNFGVTNDVLAVHTNGVEGPGGTWGALGSGADNETSLITGTGMLNVEVPVALEGIRYWDGGASDIGAIGNATSDGGAGTWNTSLKNWDAGAGVAHTNWPNTTNDLAVFQTGAGTVDLQSDITLGQILIEGVNNYSIGGNPETQTMTFGGMNSITVKLVSATFRAGIAGSPDLHLHGGGSGDRLYMDPDSADMTLGNVTVGGGAGAPNDPEFYLRGSTTGNTIAKVINGNNWSRIFKTGSGTWTVGDVAIGGLNIQAGKLVLNGTYNPSYTPFHTFTGGTLAGTGTVNHALVVPASGTIAPGDATGTLTVSGAGNNCTINGSLAITLDDGESPEHSSLAVDNTLDISAATLDLTIAGSPFTLPYVIATCGSLTGPFAATNGLTGDYAIRYVYSGSPRVEIVQAPTSIFLFK
jgi:autotransporter-associated beta strand protein